MRQTLRRLYALLPPGAQARIHGMRQELGQARIRKALAAVGAPDTATPDINHLLHHLRGQALRRLPKGAQHFVSVGCAGTWYFHWIEASYGRVARHTGVEFYSPQPSDLPDNARWIANTASDMRDIPDASADLLFSGQNLEHLWVEEIVGFLLESHRVLKDGGLLVVDSPNRLVTAKLGWSHPEHTIELTPEEMRELLMLAGFELEHQHGIWLSADPASGTVLPFEEMRTDGPWPLAKRASTAYQELDASFIWWMQARKSNRTPQAAALRRRVADIFVLAWPERINRLKTLIGHETEHQGRLWLDSGGRDGVLAFGPYMPLPAGSYAVSFSLRFTAGPVKPGFAGVCDIVAGDDCRLLARRELRMADAPLGQEYQVRLEFQLQDSMTFGVQFRVIATAGIRLVAEKAVKLEQGPPGGWQQPAVA